MTQDEVKAAAFEDISLFSGWKQCFDEAGNEYRFLDVGSNRWAVYVRPRGGYAHDGFVHRGIVRARGQTCRAIYEAYIALED